MAEGDDGEALGTAEISDLMDRGIESLALLLEPVNVLKAKGILTEDEVDSMGKRANVLRSEITKGGRRAVATRHRMDRTLRQ
jgi:hypothetical protein